ncbi:MAG: cytochrome c peroxidase, partial [Planctomycetota bacterium]
MSGTERRDLIEESAWDGALREAFGAPEDRLDPDRLESSALIGRSRISLAEPDGLAPEDEDLAIGCRVGRYVLEEEIARGGVGVVYRGRDVDLGRAVAIKVLRRNLAGETDLVRRFVEEAQIGAQLQHPGIAAVYDFGLDRRNRPWFAMPLLRGRTLATLMAARGETGGDRVRLVAILVEVARAVAHAHARGVVHRDLKPLNVIVGEFGEVQVVDWGFAKVLGRAEDEAIASRMLELERDLAPADVATVRSGNDAAASLAGAVLGTPHYMAPEQARGQVDRIDPRSDVFAIGAMLAQVLGGETPWGGGSASEAIERARAADLAPLRARLAAADADPELVALALSCLEEDPDRRPSDAGELAAAIERWLEDLEGRAERARIEGAEARVRAAQERRNRRLVVALASLLGLLLLGVGLVWVARTRELDLDRRDAAAAITEARLHLERGEWSAAEAALRRRGFNSADERQRAERAALLAELATGRRRERFREALREARLAVGEPDARVDGLFSAAFAGLGCDLQSEEGRAAAVARLAELPDRADIARGLDDWAMARRHLQRGDEAAFVEVARALDEDAARDAIRRAWRERDADALEALVADGSRSPLEADLLGCALADEGRTTAALTVLRAACADDAREFWVNLHLAALLQLEGENSYDEAHRHAMVAAMRAPESAGVQRILARVHARGGDLARVERMAEEALRDHPQDLEPIQDFAELFEELGRTERARELWNHVLARRPGDPRALDGLSRLDGGPDERGPLAGRGLGPRRRRGPPGQDRPLDPRRFADLRRDLREGSADGRSRLELASMALEVGAPELALEAARSVRSLDASPTPALRRATDIACAALLELGRFDEVEAEAAEVEPRDRDRGRISATLAEAAAQIALLSDLEAGGRGLFEVPDAVAAFQVARRRGRARLAVEIAREADLLARFRVTGRESDLRALAAAAVAATSEYGPEEPGRDEARALARAALDAFLDAADAARGEGAESSRRRGDGLSIEASRWILDQRPGSLPSGGPRPTSTSTNSGAIDGAPPASHRTPLIRLSSLRFETCDDPPAWGRVRLRHSGAPARDVPAGCPGETAVPTETLPTQRRGVSRRVEPVGPAPERMERGPTPSATVALTKEFAMKLRNLASLTAALALALTGGLMAQGGPGGPGGGGGPGGPPPPPPPGAFPPLPAAVIAPPQNPTTSAKVVLGKMLFWEEQLSSDNTVACGTCHRPEAGGGDPRVGINPGNDLVFGTPDDGRNSPGVRRSDALNDYLDDVAFGLNVQVTRRTAPTMINAAFAPQMFWDGRATSTFINPQTGVVSIPAGGALESQAAGPPLANAEMAHDMRNWGQIVAKLQSVTPMKLASNLTPDIQAALSSFGTYPALFQSAFGSTTITAERIAFAIAAYERTLVSNQSPWDLYNAGNPAALTMSQAMGAGIFFGPGQCNVCHQAPLFSDNSFRNLGLRPVGEDGGRFEQTGNAADQGRFKVPTLRNSGLRPRFMHQGEFGTMAQVMAFYGAGGGPFPLNKDPVLALIGLPAMAQVPLADFVQNALTDPRVAAGLPPFDRPTLFSESTLVANPAYGLPTAGTGGFVPQFTADSPSNLGNVDFKVGVRGALGGSVAWLAVSPNAVAQNVSGLNVLVDLASVDL